MELTRRQFGLWLLASGAAILTGARTLGEIAGNTRFVRAVKAKMFPGKVVPFDPEEAGKPGKWSG